MNKENQSTKQLSAPQADALIFQAVRFPEIIDNQTKDLTFKLFQRLKLIDVCGQDERRELWITAPRGSIEEFANYEEYLEDGEVESREEFDELWLSEYSEPQKWYLLTTVIYKEIHSVFIGGKLVLQYNPEPQGQYAYDKSELVDWLIIAVDKAIISLKLGEYNENVSKNLPYCKRLGKIVREDFWSILPEEKETYLKDIEPNEIARFVELINEQPTDSPVLRLQEITAGLFFDCCRLGYEANRYVGIEKSTPKEMYRRLADGRDEGLLKLDEASAKAFDTWFHDKARYGGHPWEVCRGGNSTHISLYAHHDEKGWWLTLAGSNLGRLVETVKFYLALVEHSLPVFLNDCREIAAMLTGKDYIGIVPEGVVPCYCDSLFPDEKMFTFMNLPWEEPEKVEMAASWYPNRDVRLV